VRPGADHETEAVSEEVKDENQLRLLLRELSGLIADFRANRGYPRRLVVRTRKRMRFVDVQEIEWIEADVRSSLVHLRDGRLERLSEPIGRLEGQLDPLRFARVHRSAIVNLDRVEEVVSVDRSQTVVLKSGIRLPLGRQMGLRVSELAEHRQVSAAPDGVTPRTLA
jgi:DNA-binding LytR/AlgR family response regulator